MPSNPPRNVLLIYFDDLCTSLDRYGPRPAHTPNIDRLAQRGVNFSHAVCQAPLCNPSRASMMTGLRPQRTGVYTLKKNQFKLHPETVTLPRLCRDQGYFTGRAGKVFHMGVPDSICMHASGPDDPAAWEQAHNCPGYELNSGGHYHNATPWHRYPSGAGGAIAWLRAVGEKADRQQHDYQVATRVIDMMEQADNASRPFFLAAGFVRPHVPLVAPERFFELYDDWDIELPDRSHGAIANRPAAYDGMFASNFEISEQEHRDAIRAYYACVSFADEQVGRLLDALEANDRSDDTLVVLTADHGYQLGEHGLWFKNFLYSESVRVPLVIADPALPEGHGRTYDSPTESVDIFATVTQRLSIDQPEDVAVDSTSLVGALRDPAASRESTACSQIMAGTPKGQVIGRTARDARWTYAELQRGEPIETQLFDRDADPLEMHNLADDPGLRDVRERLHAVASERCNWPEHAASTKA